jgi:transposase
MINPTYGVEAGYCIPDELWERIEPLLPKAKAKPLGGRPKLDDRQVMTAIFYVLRTGCQWKAIPRSLGAGSTVHDRFQQWVEEGVFQKLWKAGLLEYDEKKTGLEMAVYGWSDDKGPVRRRKDREKPH